MRPYSSNYRPSLVQTCPQCGRPFRAFQCLIDTDRAKHCSRRCKAKTQSQRLGEQTIKAFWDKVNKSGECWIWTGSHVTRGYGTVRIHKKAMYAHRLAYLLHYGELPEEFCVCHHCDNPACVRPEHLFLGTAIDNNRDMVRKGRNVLPPLTGRVAPKGEASLKAKLKNEQIVLIRTTFANGNISIAALARQFGIDSAHCCRIVHRQIWKHI